MQNRNYKWRDKIGKIKNQDELDWRIGLYKEFIEFVDETYELSCIYDWSFWGGGTDNFAVTFSQQIRDGKCISIKMIPSKNYSYYACFSKTTNPNNIKDNSLYSEFVGNTIDAALKYIHTYLLENKFTSEHSGIREKGFGYEKCFMRIRWAKEEMVDKLMKNEFSKL